MVFSDTIKNFKMRSLWIIQVSLNRVSVLIRNTRKRTDTPGEGRARLRQSLSVVAKAVNECRPLKLEWARKDSPLQPSDGILLCQHFDFKFLASRTMREWICSFKPFSCSFS